MNGWLFPSGKFVPCKIGEHGEIGKTLKPGRYIHITPSSAFSDLPPTERQREWLISSLQVVKDETYKDMVQIILEKS